MVSRAIFPFLLGALGALPSLAQEIASIPGASPLPSASEASILNQKNARTITLSIPAPRGPILDRNGVPLAQNRVAWQLAVQFEQFEKEDRETVIRWARERVERAKALMKGRSIEEPTDDQLWNHYRDRRWLPLYLSGHIGADDKKRIEPQLTKGLILSAVYQRYYPEGESAAHIVGYTGITGKLPTGPINYNDPLWEQTIGRSGLEKAYETTLQGDSGMKNLLFDKDGRKLLEEQVKRPRPGGAVVTTINETWQKQAEKSLKANAKRGAFVLIDVNTGEVLVMASRPSFDLNDFIPRIGDKEYQGLVKDPSAPLFGRAFQSSYQPGSTFKPMVAMTGLENGTITEDTEIYCPASITLGGHTFNNHNHKAAGDLTVRQAMAVSNNPFFMQLGQRAGVNEFLNTARRFGYGEKTGLPLDGEASGLVPDNQWMIVHENRRFQDGDAFNLAIGQGVLEASPLQVAQGMAAIGNGGVLPKLHLIYQTQDSYGRVTFQATPQKRNALGINAKAIDITRKGMRDVVEYGTGKAGELSFAELCGKTGTAQWSGGRYLAWFAGFLPYDEPRYAFAAVYEGRPGEHPSGGKNAAPIVKEFFEPLKDEFKEILAPPPKATEIADEPAPPKAKPLDENGDDAPADLPLDMEPGTSAPAPHANKRQPRHATPVDEGDGTDQEAKPAKRPARDDEQDRPRPVPVDGDGDEDGDGI